MFLMGENGVRIDQDNTTALGDRPRSGAVADFDGDGRADFVARHQGFPALQVVNETIPTTFWLAFDLVGEPPNPMGGLASSASAVGARVDLFDLSVSGDCDYGAASLWQTREKRAGHSNSTTSSEAVVRFGLSLRDDLCAQVSLPSGRLTRMRLYTPGGTPVASKYTLQEGASDIDLDEVPDIFDNCPADANAAQTDNDRDGIGNECDPSPDGSGGGGSNCDTCICNLEFCESGGEMIGSGPDYDGDGYVASYDMLVMLEAIGSPGGKGDLNKDGVVDISDMEVFLKYYGQAMPKSEK